MSAVDVVVVRARPPAIDRNHSRLIAAKEEICAQRTLHARLQLKQLEGVAGLEWKIGYFQIAHYHAELRVRCLNHRGAGGMKRRRKYVIAAEDDFNPNNLSDACTQVTSLGIGKTVSFYFQAIGADRQ